MESKHALDESNFTTYTYFLLLQKLAYSYPIQIVYARIWIKLSLSLSTLILTYLNVNEISVIVEMKDEFGGESGEARQILHAHQTLSRE